MFHLKNKKQAKVLKNKNEYIMIVEYCWVKICMPNNNSIDIRNFIINYFEYKQYQPLK